MRGKGCIRLLLMETKFSEKDFLFLFLSASIQNLAASGKTLELKLGFVSLFFGEKGVCLAECNWSIVCLIGKAGSEERGDEKKNKWRFGQSLVREQGKTYMKTCRPRNMKKCKKQNKIILSRLDSFLLPRNC